MIYYVIMLTDDGIVWKSTEASSEHLSTLDWSRICSLHEGLLVYMHALYNQENQDSINNIN